MKTDSRKANLENLPPRKAKKHVSERKRRERINAALNELKELVLEAKQENPEDYNKLEKADILEITTEHLKNIRRRSNYNGLISERIRENFNEDKEGRLSYMKGFMSCASEVSQFLKRSPEVQPEVAKSVTSFLYRCSDAIIQRRPPVATGKCDENRLSTDDVTSVLIKNTPSSVNAGNCRLLPEKSINFQSNLLIGHSTETRSTNNQRFGDENSNFAPSHGLPSFNTNRSRSEPIGNFSFSSASQIVNKNVDASYAPTKSLFSSNKQNVCVFSENNLARTSDKFEHIKPEEQGWIMGPGASMGFWGDSSIDTAMWRPW